MIIRLERTGGFAGMTRTIEVDSRSLPEDQANAVRQLVGNANFFALPENLSPAPPVGADRFNYRITIQSDSESHTVELTEADTPESLEQLIGWLEDHSRTAGSTSAP